MKQATWSQNLNISVIPLQGNKVKSQCILHCHLTGSKVTDIQGQYLTELSGPEPL